jgi:colanic acid biosynthesis glycosyl transferase WcaI
MTDPPFAGTIGAAAARMRQRPLLYWVQDLHPDIGIEIGIVRHPTVIATWRRAQRVALRSASAIAVLGEDMADRVTAYGIDRSSLAVIPNGAAAGPEPGPVDARHPIVSRLRGGYRFVAMHAGNLGVAGAWSTLIEAAGLLTERSIGLVFVGNGAKRPDMERSAVGRANISFYDYLPWSDVQHVMAAGDLQIVTVRAGLEGLVVPSKMYSLLAAGRPMLAVTSETSDVARLVRRHGCGLVADPTSPSSVAAAMRWAQDNPDAIAAMSHRARQAAPEYERAAMLRRLADMAEAAVDRAQSTRRRSLN